MLSKFIVKFGNDKFRFHITTVETDNESITIGGNNYNAFLSIVFSENNSEFQKINDYLTESFIEICEKIHHRVVVPSKSPVLNVEISAGQVNVSSLTNGLQYSFPERSVAVCPILNATIHDLAIYVGECLSSKLREKSAYEEIILKIKVKVTQNIGDKIAVAKFKFS